MAFGADINFSNVPTASYVKSSKDTGIKWDSVKILAECQKQISDQAKILQARGVTVLKVIECKHEVSQFDSNEELVRGWIHFIK